MDFNHLFNSDHLKEKYLKLQKLKKRQKALQDRVGRSQSTPSNEKSSKVAGNTRSKRKNPFLK